MHAALAQPARTPHWRGPVKYTQPRAVSRRLSIEPVEVFSTPTIRIKVRVAQKWSQRLRVSKRDRRSELRYSILQRRRRIDCTNITVCENSNDKEVLGVFPGANYSGDK